MDDSAPIPETGSRWSLDFVKSLAIFGSSRTYPEKDLSVMRHSLYLVLVGGVLASLIGCGCGRSALSPQCQGLGAWLRGSRDREPEN